jgi:hypothetical protein
MAGVAIAGLLDCCRGEDAAAENEVTGSSYQLYFNRLTQFSEKLR